MALLHYLDFEPPLADEGWTVTEVGLSTAVRTTDASFPERGSFGLRCTIVGTDRAFMTKTTSISISPGGSLYTGFWLRPSSLPSASLSLIADQESTPGLSMVLYLYNTGRLRFRVSDDVGGFWDVANITAIIENRWYWIVYRIDRATTNIALDGGGALYLDGSLVNSINNVDNYDRFVDNIELDVGPTGLAKDGSIFDFDEVKVSTTYPEPYVPTPSTANPCAERTVVLYRQASADSIEFADYCVSQLGIPRSNLCPLPNATATEALATYATFQTEVETDLNAWLTLNPTVAAQTTGFLLGYGVPGYFTNAGSKYSAASVRRPRAMSVIAWRYQTRSSRGGSGRFSAWRLGFGDGLRPGLFSAAERSARVPRRPSLSF